jgi:hypothetical protein
MTTFVLIPGAWLGGWVWEPVFLEALVGVLDQIAREDA